MLREKSAPPRAREPRAPLVERVAGWSVRHRAAAIAGWFALVVLAVGASSVLPGESARGTDPGEAGRAGEVLDAQPEYEPALENVLVERAEPGPTPFADDPALLAATEDLTATLLAVPGAVTDVRSALDNADHVSADGTSGLVSFRIAGPAEESAEHYRAVVDAVGEVAARHPGVRLAQSGDRSLAQAVDAAIEEDFARSELISLPLTVVILLVVFGSLVAAGIPLLLSVTTIAATFGLLQVVDRWLAINSATSSMVLLIGMAVGVDYTLFYLRRFREERAAGRDAGDALRTTARTSGHVVAVSGVTVILCLSGLALTGIGQLQGLTIGTVLVVGLAMIGSVTVLPALLSLLGRRVDAGRIPWLRRTAPETSRTWTAVARTVVRRPLVWGSAATLVLLAMAVPALDMHPQDAAQVHSLPSTVPAVDAALRMQDAFPGAPTPARVVVWNTDGTAVDRAALAGALSGLDARVGDGAPMTVTEVGRVLVVRVPLAGPGTGPVSDAALDALRTEALPATVGTVPGVGYAVTGRTAIAHDFAAQLNARTPLVFAFVLVLAFILLVVAFRSLAVPLVSIALNLLSIGAAYGVLTWAFQDGNLAPVLGFTAYGGVVGWLPLFMFVMLFGLSMDYHVFILSRIRERLRAGAAPRDAIVGGTGASAGVVTSAAVVMTAVFLVFVLLSAIEYQMLGVGMSVAILIDATLVRGVLLPAALALLGRRAWGVPWGRGRRVARGEDGSR